VVTGHDDKLDDLKDGPVQDAEDAGHEGGAADQAIKDGEKDYEDQDQDAADKARNVTDDGTDAMRHAGNALDELGIGDPGLDDLADAIDGGADELFGREAPDTLPDVHFRIYFGAKDALSNLKDNLVSDGLAAADSLAGDVLEEIPVADQFAEGAVSSFFEDHEAEPEGSESKWAVASFAFTEGLSELFRCEVVLSRTELKPSQDRLDHRYPDESSGSMLDSMLEPVNAAKKVVKKVEHMADDVIDDVNAIAEDPSKALDVAGDLLAGGSKGTPEANVFANLAIDPKHFLNQTASVCVTRELGDDTYPYVKRWITGIVSEFTDLGSWRSESNPSVRFVKIVIVPSLWKLSLRKDCRVFQDMMALEIVREVFRAAGIYGFLPDLPGVGAVTGLASDLASNIPLVGGGLSDALSGQFIKTLPPPDTTEQEWTPKREYCVQYEETDLDFVLRLLAEEGISFFFAPGRGEERIVLVDDPTVLGKCQTVDGRASPFLGPWEVGMVPRVEHVWDLRQSAGLHSTVVSLRDFCFSAVALAPDKDEAAVTPSWLARPNTPGAAGALERSEYPGRFVYATKEDPDAVPYEPYAPPESARKLSARRAESMASRALHGSAQTTLISLTPGTILKVKGVPVHQKVTATETHDLMVRRVRHGAMFSTRFEQVHGIPMPERYASFGNRVEFQWVDRASPEKTRYRPPLPPPPPVIRGLQTATVVDDDGDDSPDERVRIDVPTLGRVRVRFHWDRRGENPVGIDLPLIDLGKSCWVRVAQGWAGDDFGCSFVPRVGSEVAVAFLDGNPDRPLVVGCLYNGENVPPWSPGSSDQENKKISGLRTVTHDDDADETCTSELWLDDGNDAERIMVKAGRFLLEEVRKNHVTQVGEDQLNTVKDCHGEIVEGTQTLEVVGKRTKTVAAGETDEILMERDERVGGNEEIAITGARTIGVKGRVEIKVGDASKPTELARSLTINGRRETHIGELDDPPDKSFTDDKLVKMAKTDDIVGPFVVIAGSLAGGASAGPNGAETDGQMAIGTDAEGQGVFKAGAKGNVTLHAKGKVTLKSDTQDVTVTAGEGGLHVACCEQKIDLAGTSAAASLQMTAAQKLTITSSASKAEFTAQKAALVAGGQPSAAITASTSELALGAESGPGASLTVAARGAVNMNAAAIKVG
jgi:type VI secretion system VgrG family protein